ncbi:undecaprenyldiphospho-muramoylpentapeptide beta-N-acetylglucosaminyltransferase [Thalassolituus sp. LLYu03]|uniref:undecaprenyldiphospho-muramoylpentapeptide beta-N-acetylglucosaminyltransferase n=1 Tax=Thalassolituus sp. LLYu03 TaxID=3421656 RepID=UPI003D2B36F6
MTTTNNILMMAGGTGGHVFPALAVARELAKDGYQIHWLGTPSGIENDLVPAAGIPLHTINIQGLRGKGKLGLLTAPVRVLRAVLQARNVMRSLNPVAVVGFGGYVTGPGGVAARSCGIPLLIHEQNARAGMTNRLLSRFSQCVMQAFPQAMPEALTTGNPVRQEVVALENPEQRYRAREESGEQLKVMVIGGSQGAVAINNVVFSAMASLAESERPSLVHQAGKRNFDELQQRYSDAGIKVNVAAFINDMAAAYADTDLLVCRAGALTVSEVAAAGCAAVFIPLPSAVDDHQTANARYLTDNQAGVLCPQNEFNAEWLADKLRYFAQHKDQLRIMACAARQLAMTGAATEVAAQVKRFARG